MESDLFGCVKGAFTGADKDTCGLLSQAHDQVLFLDELHWLPIEAQAKLFRFLQEMKYRRVGDHLGREISIRFKLIAAAKPEIFDLVRSIEAEFNRGKHENKQKLLRIATVNEMSRFAWSGNIRQLQNAVTRMMTFAREDIVNPSDFHDYLQTLGSLTPLPSASLPELADNVEVDQIKRALIQSKTKAEATTRLGISRWTFGRTMDRLGILPEAYLPRA